MNYTEAIEYIHSVNWVFCKPGLDRIRELCTRLGEPQRNMRFVHVAGTNGKGSFCSMLSKILEKQGLRVGLFTSPYIRFFNERMQVNSQPISNEALAEITTLVRPYAEAMSDKPTEFELISAIAFEYFRRKKCDIVVLEAGMGGRLDSTNIIDSPVLSVITGIALDHTAFLGDTVEKIAAEKAGIIKKGCPVLFGGAHTGAREVIEAAAREKGSEFFVTDYSRLDVKGATLDGTCFNFGLWRDMNIKLLGLYQPKNAASVLTAVEILGKYGVKISDSAVREGLSAARWQARFEIISREPLTLFDGAHNPEGIDSAVESIKHYFGKERVYVLSGVLGDKDYGHIAGKICEVAQKVFTMTPDNPRALSAESYAEEFTERGVAAFAFPSLSEAYAEAKKKARADGRALVVLGSLYTYAQIIEEA